MPTAAPRRLVVVTATAIALAVLAGCTAEREPAPTPSADSLDEAFAAVDAYLETLAAVGHDRGENPERLEAVAAGAVLAQSLSAAESWVRLGIRVEGEQTFFRVDGEVDGDTAEVEGCLDTSTWIFRQPDGAKAQTPDEGPEYMATYRLAQDEKGAWRVVTQTSEPGCPEFPIE